MDKQIKSEIIDLIRRYKQNQSKLSMMVQQIEEAQNRLLTRDDFMPSCTSTIGDGIFARGNNESIVERAVERLQKIDLTIAKQSSHIAEMLQEAQDYKRDIDTVDAMLSAVTEVQRFVITQFYQNEVDRWLELAPDLKKKFGKHYTTAGGIRELAKKGLETMAEVYLIRKGVLKR